MGWQIYWRRLGLRNDITIYRLCGRVQVTGDATGLPTKLGRGVRSYSEELRAYLRLEIPHEPRAPDIDRLTLAFRGAG